jgi:hypothetical protein
MELRNVFFVIRMKNNKTLIHFALPPKYIMPLYLFTVPVWLFVVFSHIERTPDV